MTYLPMNIMPEVCIRRDIIKDKDGKLISDEILICNHSDDDEWCMAYPNPEYWCKKGGCPLSSIPPKKSAEVAKKINALKASKRKARGE
jgi:hypothetical protein